MNRVKLGSVLNIKRGTSLSGKYYAERGEKVRLTLGNFNYPNGGFKENTSKTDIYFTGDVKPEFILKKGDIITPLTEQVSGLLGETARIPVDNMYIQSGDIGLVVPDEKVLDRNFAYYLINSPMMKKQLGASAQQTKIRHTSPEKIRNCEVYLPELSHQKKTGEFLDLINAKIENNNRINDELVSLLKAIYNYWFLQFEFPNEEGKPYKSSGGKMVWNEELQMVIPDDWKCVSLIELFSFTKGKIPSKLYDENDGTLSPYLTIDVVNNGFPQYCNQASMPYCDKKTIMVMDGAASGDVYTGYKGVLGSTFSMLTPKRKDVSNELLYWILKTLSVMYKKNNTGSTVPHANKSYIEAMKIALPKNCEKFGEKFVTIQDKINILNEENKELSSLREYLLPLLINRQVTFKN